MVDGLVMFSGGLDSVVSTHLLKSQGLSIKALHFVLPFYSGMGLSHKRVRTYAEALGVPLMIVEEGEEFLEMIRDPRFGYGKNANPCMDCRIHRLRKARKIMESECASFIATGEVIGQRPMSQRLDCLYKVESGAGLKGRLVRPLSAKLLPPSIPEQNGLIDREKLMAISGRGRTQQLQYARSYSLKHSSPAGGCVLTNIDPARRFLEMVSFNPDFTLADFKLLAYGRHFRLGPKLKAVIARNDSENRTLEKIFTDDDYVLQLAEVTGPYCVLRGEATLEQLELAGAITARYTKARNDSEVKIKVQHKGNTMVLTVKPADDTECKRLLV